MQPIKLTIGIALILMTCMSLVNADAMCVASLEDVHIICADSNCDFGVGQPIENITILLQENIGDVENMEVIISLCRVNTECVGSDELDRITALTDSHGKVYIGDTSDPYSFNYEPTHGGEMFIRTIVDPDGIAYEVTRPLVVANTLELILNCPSQGFIDKDVECTWNVYIAGTAPRQKIDATPTITVMQGTNEVAYTPTFDSVTFTTSITGSVDVFVSVDNIDYIGDSDTAQIPINHPVLGQTFFIDNNDFFTYTGIGISKGTHRLELNIDESGDPVAVRSIDAEVRTPSGQTVPLTFNFKNGNWVSTYNFEQEGQTYQLSGNVVFEDIATSDLPFEYQIVTSSGIADSNKTSITLIIIGGAVGLILVIGILIFIFRKGKKIRK